MAIFQRCHPNIRGDTRLYPKVQGPCVDAICRDNPIQSSGHGPPKCVENLSKVHYFPRLTNEFRPLRNSVSNVGMLQCAAPASCGLWSSILIGGPPCFVSFALSLFGHSVITDARDDVWLYKGCLWEKWMYCLTEAQYHLHKIFHHANVVAPNRGQAS